VGNQVNVLPVHEPHEVEVLPVIDFGKLAHQPKPSAMQQLPEEIGALSLFHIFLLLFRQFLAVEHKCLMEF
jgi:hypothetical protein